MKKLSVGRFVSVGGILTALAIILQSAPLFLPVIGLALSPLSTLPIALAAYYQVTLGIAVFFSSVVLLIFVYVQEAVILLFTTGLLGVTIGTLLFRKGIVVSILLSSMFLALGMISLTYLLGVPVFGDVTHSFSPPMMIAIFLVFSLIYASVWNYVLKRLFSQRWLLKS